MRFLFCALLAAGASASYKVGKSDGSCYAGGPTHAITCNVAKDDCDKSWYPSGKVSGGGSNCCHCRGGCIEGSENDGGTACADGSSWNDGAGGSSKGSCYAGGPTHAITCDVAPADCTGTWYPPGYVSGTSGCCHCKAGCTKADQTCECMDKYADDPNPPSPSPCPAPAAPAAPSYKLGASDGSCYTGGTVSCNVLEAACNGYHYPAGKTSSHGNKCCHCRGGCPEGADNHTLCDHEAASPYWKDESKGSCYNPTTHKVTCNMHKCPAGEAWYPPGYVGSSGCCHCKAGCKKADQDSGCADKYHDGNIVASPPPALPKVECVPAADMEKREDGLNEACYVHGPPCDGYVVCCVKKGTCKETHGGMVMASANYYDGGCWPDTGYGAEGSFGPGCGTKVGECNAPIMSLKGATTKEGNMAAVSEDTSARLFNIARQGGGEVCQTWDIIEFSFVLDGADLSKEFTGHNGKTGAVCKVIAEKVGVAIAYVTCSAAAAAASSRLRKLAGAGVTISASIMAVGAGVSAASVVNNINTNLGTPADIVTALATAYPTATITAAPTTTVADPSGSNVPLSSLAGLSTGAIIGIAVGAGVGGLLIIVAIYCLVCKKGKAPTKASSV